MYKVPLFDLNFGEEEAKAAYDTIKSGWISTGAKCLSFEERFANMLEAKHALTLANCTTALHLAMILCGVKAGDEVLCPSLSFVATANVIKYVGAKPVFCDIAGFDNLTIAADEIEKKISPKTKAIIVMHFGGFACEMEKIVAIAKKHKIMIVEDACHAPLSVYQGKKLGTIGDIGCFSFFSNKNISTGEGGMLITDNEEIYKRAKLLRSHGMTTMSYQRASGHATEYDVIDLGYNYRLDDIHAAIGLAQLDKLEQDLHKRVALRERYISHLKESDKIIIPFKDYQEFSTNYIFTVVLKDSNKEKRDLMRSKLAENGIQTSVHYPSIHRFSIYEQERTSLPLTEYVSDNLITLPMYGNLKIEAVDFVCEAFLKILGEI
ncbi:MAG TPA: DegT/DnrJ/EryC1/StrS family aminotransferase [Candidatus Cloacimonadota bacterium]|jgi:dTDP-4-amino-4,6-dideoxygalactose transaminase|nr:DegT/DnrJ/EryC1/StrS family aminotransferase [Candidatus Cloacimonadales bacterium]HPY96056.1 DegT/DnrJ/EryC1/StrS family aminotransferase [Candidatus Cloacimonadota bacterium]HQB40477.1 DegT/DnrJ/EryC1/StrS family aminotransferase [Candidatus Cloacimonadota bacterium]